MKILSILSFFLFSSQVFCSNLQNAYVGVDENTGAFSIHDQAIENYAAYGSFSDEIFLTGWSYLDIKSNGQFNDSVQAYAAGLVEGYLTSHLIDDHFSNLIEDYCRDEKQYCHLLSSFLKENMNFIKENVETKRHFDEYWHQVALTLEQLHGLEDGYRNITSQPSIEVDVMGLLLLNMFGDLLDLEKVLKRKQPRAILGSGSCSAIVKVLPDFQDIYFSHVTWDSYNAMLRILKKYDLQLHKSLEEGSPLIPGHTYSFSSQPGLIFSVDDFYLISSGLAVMETSIVNDNSNLWKFVQPNKIIFDWQRNIIANRLANNGREWVEIFSMFNSGTYNNQFMILDYKKFESGKPLKDGLLYVIEQLPGYTHSADVTDVLRSQSYWPSYNVPYFKEIFNMSGTQQKVKKYGDFFSYEKCPRALIFKRDHEKVKDVDSLMKLMRYNDFMEDPLSKCNCTPPFSADNAISSRNDLNPSNGIYPFPALGHGQSGGIDMKLTTSKLFETLEFVAIAGPTYDPLPPFQWSKTDFGKKVKHKGHPDLFQFKPILHKWDV